MFRKILYLTDYSKDVEKALEYVKKLKEIAKKIVKDIKDKILIKEIKKHGKL